MCPAYDLPPCALSASKRFFALGQVQLLLPCPLVGRSLCFRLIPFTVTLFLGGLAWPDLSPQLDYPAGPFLSGGLRLRGPSLAAPGWEQVAVALHIVGKQFLKNPSPRPH